MNNDKFINKLAQAFGISRKQVTDTLKQMSAMSMVQEELKKMKQKKQ